MKMLRTVVAVFAVLVLSMGLVACEKKGPMEKAGEKIDRGVEKTKDAVQDAVQGRAGGKSRGEDRQGPGWEIDKSR